MPRPSPASSTCPATSGPRVSTRARRGRQERLHERRRRRRRHAVPGRHQRPRACGSRSSGPVNTFFARVLGINSFAASRSSKAEYVLPVPMGSPENYYGVFGELRHPGGGITTVTTNTFNNVTTSWFSAANTKGTNAWTTPDQRLHEQQRPGHLDHRQPVPAVGRLRDHARRHRHEHRRHRGPGRDVSRSGTGNQSNCQIQFELSWDNGGDLHDRAGTGVKLSTALPLATSETYQPFGTAHRQVEPRLVDDRRSSATRTSASAPGPSSRRRPSAPAAILHRIDHLQRPRHATTTRPRRRSSPPTRTSRARTARR